MKKESIEEIIKENASGKTIHFTFMNNKTQHIKNVEDIVIKDDYIEFRENNRMTYLDINSIIEILVTEKEEHIDYTAYTHASK